MIQPATPLEHILFFDIETVPVVPFFEDLTPGLQKEWERKMKVLKNNVLTENIEPAKVFSEKAGVYSEFAKPVCIGLGAATKRNGNWYFTYKALVSHSEKSLLNQFCEALTRFQKTTGRDVVLAGHNIKEFDVPFLARRMLINGMSLPKCLNLTGLKPWEIPHVDTMELWKFGDWKNYTTLNLLAEVFGIPSPKSDIDGSQVGRVYWEEKDLERIAQYCARDVVTTAQVYLRLTGQSDIVLQPELAETAILA